MFLSLIFVKRGFKLRFIVVAFVDIAIDDIDDIDDTMCFFSNIPCHPLLMLTITANFYRLSTLICSKWSCKCLWLPDDD